MAERGHTVQLLVLARRVAEEWPTALPVRSSWNAQNAAQPHGGFLRARRFLRGFRPDLVHSHSFHRQHRCAPAQTLHSVRIVLSTIHNVYEGGWQRMLAYRLTDGLSRHTTAVSQAAADRFVRLKAVPSASASVLTNGIDTAEFAPNADRRDRMRAEMGAGDEFVWLAAGRIAPAKDYPNLLRAFAQVRAACPDAQLWIAGEGHADEVPSRFRPWRLIGLVASALAGSCAAIMPALLDAADGFVLASAWEGMPLAVGEAMAMEKPVVATDVGGVRELVGDAGVLVPAKNPDALAEAMLDMMRSPPEDAAALGRAARERIRSQFSMDAKADEWEALYTRLLRRNV